MIVVIDYSKQPAPPASKFYVPLEHTDPHQQLADLSEAIEILRAKRVQLIDGPEAIWRTVLHASDHLEAQVIPVWDEIRGNA